MRKIRERRIEDVWMGGGGLNDDGGTKNVWFQLWRELFVFKLQKLYNKENS